MHKKFFSFRISDRSNSDSSGDSDYDNRERRRNLRELQADEMNHEIERVDDIWERMIRAEAELPYGYFDAIAATTEVKNACPCLSKKNLVHKC